MASPPREEGYESREVRIGRLLAEMHDRGGNGSATPSPTESSQLGPESAAELRADLEALHEISAADTRIEGLIRQGVLLPPTNGECLAKLGPYSITGYLGRGGMGVVLKAFDPVLNRTVALKILRPDMADDPGAVARFNREARAAAALHHPNVVTVYAVGEDRGVQYIAMEYVEGESLAQLIRRSAPLPGDVCRRIFAELMSGLAAAHAAGLVHRDIKPANILLDGPEQHVKITDFGLVRLLASQTRLTVDQSAFGTPEYMSPEQVRGEENIDHRSDLYSAGVVLYEMLTGSSPFAAESPAATLGRILHDDSEDARKINGNVNAVLRRLAWRLMRKPRPDRLQSAQEVLMALRTGRSLPRRPVWVAWTATCAAGGLTMLLSLQYWSNPRPVDSKIAGAVAATSTGESIAPIANRRITAPYVREGQKKCIIVTYDDDPAEHTFAPLSHDDRTDYAGAALCDVSPNEQVIVAGLTHVRNGACIVAYDEEANERWSFPFVSPIDWPQCALGDDTFVCRKLKHANLDEKAGDEILVTVHHSNEYPACIAIMKVTRDGIHVIGEAWHAGHIEDLLVVPKYFNDRPSIVAFGRNYILDGFEEPTEADPPAPTQWKWVSVAMILDPAAIITVQTGVVPFGAPRLELPSLPVHAYAILDLPESRKALAGTWSEPLEFGHIHDLLLTGGYGADITDPCFTVTANANYEIDSNDRVTLRGGATLRLDRNLNVVRDDGKPMIDVDSQTRVGKTPEFWAQRWKVIIQNGEAVQSEAPAAGSLTTQDRGSRVP